jgi:hypothetical protein
MRSRRSEQPTAAQRTSVADLPGIRLAVTIALLESAATWAVRRALDSGYRLATGHVPPTARDPNVPFRRIVAWAVVTATAVTAADVAVDRFALRREPASEA